MMCMAQLSTRGLAASQRTELWERWKAGESLSDIGNALGKHAASIFGAITARGGIAPPLRRRSRRSLTLEEREDISRGLAAGNSIRAIAAGFGRTPSTVSREIRRHSSDSPYRAAAADARAWENARRPKPCRLARERRLRRVVATKLALDWSPEQVAGWLRVRYPDQPAMHVSHETIYRSLFVQARGVLKKELLAHLRSRRLMRRAKCATTKGQPRGQIIDAVSISERPADANDRAVPGHWEGDLLTGSRNSHIATLVERHSRYTMLVKVKGKDTVSVVRALSAQIRKLPAELCRSLTWDRGGEMAQHKQFTVATSVKVYFCDPQSPWQRGTNENTNRLLRQYFPKGTDISGYTQADLNRIALRLNQRPRKTLGFGTPANKLMAAVAATG